jgi:hypothetical protein
LGKVIHEYAFERLNGGSPEWPDKVDATLVLVSIVDNLCDKLEQLCPKPTTPEKLAASPGNYIPLLKFILEEYEEEHIAAKALKGDSTQTLPRLFSLTPLPSLQWRFISINAELLSSLVPSVAKPNNPSEYARVFYHVFNFEPFRLYR